MYIYMFYEWVLQPYYQNSSEPVASFQFARVVYPTDIQLIVVNFCSAYMHVVIG